ncbi:SIS domain-containing protein [Fibrobacterota bacterium]
MIKEFFHTYLKDLNQVFTSVNADGFEALIDVLSRARNSGAQIFLCGNGGSASTASHMVCDLNKGCSEGKGKRFKLICLNDNIASMLAYGNDMSYEDIFVEQLKNYFNPGDLVIGISGSGNSENVIRAVQYGNDNRGVTFGLCGMGGGRLRTVAKKSLVIPSDDMQKIEDMHMIIVHCIMQWFMSD